MGLSTWLTWCVLLNKCSGAIRGQEFSRPGVKEARSSGGQQFRRPAVLEASSSGGGCQESVRRPGGGLEWTGVQEARCHLSGDRLQGGCCHSAEQGPRVRHQELSRVKVRTDANSLRVGVRQKSSQMMDDDSSLKRYSKRYQECSRRMEDEEQRQISSMIQKMGIGKGIIP